jgi:hypothetical protein
VVAREGDRSSLSVRADPKLEAFAAGPNDFFYQGTMDRLRFLADATCTVTDRRIAAIAARRRPSASTSRHRPSRCRHGRVSPDFSPKARRLILSRR